MKTYVWGIGKYFESKINESNISFYKIEGLVDEFRTGNLFGKEIIHPNKISGNEMDTIVIGSPNYQDDILNRIRDFGIITTTISLDEYIKRIWIENMPVDVYAAINERERMLSMALSAELIPQEKMKYAKAYANRVCALELIPKGGVVAEVGVAYGDFSKIMMGKLKPKKIIAIDYFNGNNPGGDFWGRNDFNDSGLTHYEWYSREFSSEISSGFMEVRQGLSWDVLETFPNEYFDFIYLDACHSYDSVKKDVDVITKKIKDGGIITFNDYTMYNFYTDPLNSEGYYGVANVVNELICNTNSIVLGLALERCLSMDLILEYHE